MPDKPKQPKEDIDQYRKDILAGCKKAGGEFIRVPREQLIKVLESEQSTTSKV